MGSKKNAKVTDVKHRIYQITYMSLVTTIYLLLINPFISFDGWQYISSAKSLFDRNEMAQHYFWVREPGFPLLVKMFSINGSFLWGVIIFNFILFMLSFFYFYIQVMKSIKLNRNLEHFCLAVSYIGSVTLVGGYAGNFGKDLIIISTNLLFSALCISVFKNHTNGQFNWSKVSLCLVLLFSSSLSKPLSYAFGVTLALLLVGNFLIYRIKLKSIDLFLYLGTLVVFLLLIPIYWREELRKAITSPLFNKQNFTDPFWDLSVRQILSRFGEDIVLVQTIPVALLSLLGIGSNLGWMFSRNQLKISPSQNGDIGYGLLAQHYPNCNISKPHGFIANIEFLQEESNQKLCGISAFDLPNILFYPTYMIFLVLLMLFLFNLKTILSNTGALYLVSYSGSTFLYISFFAISGGAIDRYGALLIPIVFMSLGLLVAQNAKPRKLVR